jgi:glutamine synthetase
MVADPETFHVLPWAENTGWLLCDCYFPNGKRVPIATRQLYRDALAKLAKAGFDYLAGLEVEFHLFKIEDLRLAPETITWPPEPPTVSHTTHGFQYLTEGRYDQVAPIMDVLRSNLAALGLPLRSLEVELGPSQYEFTFAPETGMVPADTMVLFRSAMKQVARRHGYLVSFMCRPGLPNSFASGWHLHQSLLDRRSKANAFVSHNDKEPVSPLGRGFLAGLLANARAAAAFATPTLNGYKRYHGVNTMAPIQAIWAQDTRRDGAGDGELAIRRRIREPSASRWQPHLYMASQIRGTRRHRPQARSRPVRRRAVPTFRRAVARTLAEALAALRTNDCFRAASATFVNYYAHIKRPRLRGAARRPWTSVEAQISQAISRRHGMGAPRYFEIYSRSDCAGSSMNGPPPTTATCITVSGEMAGAAFTTSGLPTCSGPGQPASSGYMLALACYLRL